MSTLDLIGPGLTLFVADDGDASAWRAAANELDHDVPVTVEVLPGTVAHAIGIHRPGGAILVRPDGVPVATWWTSRDRSADLNGAIDALLRPPTHDPRA